MKHTESALSMKAQLDCENARKNLETLVDDPNTPQEIIDLIIGLSTHDENYVLKAQNIVLIAKNLAKEYRKKSISRPGDNPTPSEIINDRFLEISKEDRKARRRRFARA